MNVNMFGKANRIIKACESAAFGVIDGDGYPSVSMVSPINAENIFEIYCTTGIGGNKTGRLRNNNRASYCFNAGYDNVTLVGEAEILTDQETKNRFWKDWFIDHYPGGAGDPTYVVIRFTTKRASLWIDGESASFTIDELLTVQSQCGLLCNGCPYKISHGCAGCIALNGNPFWGECPVAKCCQDKGYTHCGECGDMPCDILNDFSCGESEHSDRPAGSRIEICRAWKFGG